MADIRKLSVIGQSRTYYLTLPKGVIDELSWRKGQKLQVQLKGKAILIKDWVPRKKKGSK